MRTNVLRVGLVLRAAIAIAFAVYLGAMRPDSPQQLLGAFARYAFADAIGALLTITLTIGLHWRTDLIVLTIIGSIFRLTAALTIWFGPGIPYFAVTFVLYVALLATLGFVNGLLDLVEARHMRAEGAGIGIHRFVLLEGFATLIMSVLAFFLTPLPAMVATLLMIGALLEAAALLFLAIRPSSAWRRLVPSTPTADAPVL
jgi:hypothetical protein